MRVSLRVMPGLRVSASSRGFRTHVGPRAARLHFGTGAPGVSTGAGPVSLYQSLGRRSSRPARSAPAGLTATQAKALEARRIAEELAEIESLHRVTFTPARFTFTRTFEGLVNTVPAVDAEAVHRRHAAAARRGVPWYALSRRQQAARAAQQRAAQEIRHLESERARQVERQQRRREDAEREAHEQWQALLRNDEDLVIPALVDAFGDNTAPVAPLGVDEDGTVELLLMLPGTDAVPGRMPGVTEAGNPSLRSMTRQQTGYWYLQLVAGYLLVTVKEALAVAPGVTGAHVVAVRRAGDDWVPLVEAEISRDALADAVLDDTPAEVLEAVADTLVLDLADRTLELRPLHPSLSPPAAQAVALLDHHPLRSTR